VRNDVILVLVVITALAFDFTNGFHDTGNAMATSIATGALPPRVAVALSGLLNLVGAFLSLAVAATIANGLVDIADVTLSVVAAGLAGGIIWNLITWLFGIPSSSSHALIGGVIGSTLAAAGGSAVLWKGLASKVVIPAALSPIIAALVAAVGTWLLYRISRSLTRGARTHGFRTGQVGSACMVSSAPGSARRAPTSAGMWPAEWPPPGCSPFPRPGWSAPSRIGSPTASAAAWACSSPWPSSSASPGPSIGGRVPPRWTTAT
jgi:inorganic phosphate transporter, PiT family